MKTNRYAFKVEYDGAGFCGWQRQSGQLTVQEVLESAIARLEPQAGRIVAAGRTDSGVHALGQVFHADLKREWDPFPLREALNAHLRPQKVSILAVASVEPGFSARHSALARIYHYRILNRRPPPTVASGFVWHLHRNLDVEAMRLAAVNLIGRHDFTTFRSAHCQAASPVKTLDSLDIVTMPASEGLEIRVIARARSFLHRQVRSMVGTLERVGAGAMAPPQVAEILQARDRASCGPVAPAKGLYLVAVEYEPDPFADAALERNGNRTSSMDG